MSDVVDPRDRVAYRHLRMSLVFISIVLLSRAWRWMLGYMVELLHIYIYVREKDLGGLVLVCGMLH